MIIHQNVAALNAQHSLVANTEATSQKENFGIDQTMKVIQSFAKTIEHSLAYLSEVRELLRKNKYKLMPTWLF